jgi:hypothetical protein
MYTSEGAHERQYNAPKLYETVSEYLKNVSARPVSVCYSKFPVIPTDVASMLTAHWFRLGLCKMFGAKPVTLSLCLIKN